MSDISYGDKIYKLLFSIEKNMHTPDLHSFTAYIKNGNVFVDANNDGICIQEYYDNGKSNQYCGSLISASNRLEMLGIDLLSVEI